MIVCTIAGQTVYWNGNRETIRKTYLAIEMPGEDSSNEWCEPVTDEEYNAL